MKQLDDKILNKIKKCLALSQSPEPHEAAAALRQAQKLMDLHGVSQADLGRAEIGEATVKSKASVSRIKDWELALLNTVARAFGCRLMWAKSYSHNEEVFGHYTIVGLKTQVPLAAYTTEVLQRKLMSSRARFVTNLPEHLSRQAKTMEADGFCHGWVATIRKTVHEFAMGDEVKALIDDHIKAVSSGKEAGVQKRRLGYQGYQAGQQAALGESIHKPINGAAAQRLLINGG